jgi:hypothetical protein
VLPGQEFFTKEIRGLLRGGGQDSVRAGDSAAPQNAGCSEQRLKPARNRLVQLDFAAIRVSGNVAEWGSQVVVVENEHAGQFPDRESKVRERAWKTIDQLRRRHVVPALGDAYGDSFF